jgi:hypothetical protein
VVSLARCISIPLLLPFLAVAAEKSANPPGISVNYPSWKGDRFVTLTLDGFSQRKLSVINHGAPSELVGISLEDFLARAGWNHLPQTDVSSYVVHVEGPDAEQASFPLTDQRAWLVIEPAKTGHPNAEAELIVLNEHGVITQTIPGIRKIRVSRAGN